MIFPEILKNLLDITKKTLKSRCNTLNILKPCRENTLTPIVHQSCACQNSGTYATIRNLRKLLL